MAVIRAMTGETRVRLDAGWTMALCQPDACAGTKDTNGLDWIPARVPGTAAGALRDAGRLTAQGGAALLDQDVWFRCTIRAQGPHTLRFHGLTPPAEVFLDGAPILSAASMFRSLEHELDAAGAHDLMIRFPALAPYLAGVKGQRARWRAPMMSEQALRHVRRTPFGFMPGWTPPLPPIGPFRPVELIARGAPFRVTDLSLRPRLDGGTGRLSVTLRLDRSIEAAVVVHCAGVRGRLERDGERRWSGDLTIAGVAPWFPHTHGDPTRHRVTLHVGDVEIDAGHVGFRTIVVDRGADGAGFGLVVNGLPVFARGAVMTPTDPVALQDDRLDERLDRAVEAGMNMLRVSGALPPESDAFHEACDRRGILVWRDLPFANFDYPRDEAFMALAEAETHELERRLETSPSLAVVSGGSEIDQQAAMMGLAAHQRAHPLFDERLRHHIVDGPLDVVYLRHSPQGGPLPFAVREGVAHYFGVGAYRRPVDDARRSGVRFASECLAFANPPRPAAARAFGSDAPRDAGADWDFADVRDHYVAALYGVDAKALQATDPARAGDLGRAAVMELMEAVFAEWRRPGSSCRGGLVLTLADMAAGAGWGVIDADGAPKLAWHGLKRAFAPVGLGLTDEGLNGLDIHLFNDRPTPLEAALSIAGYGSTPNPVFQATRRLTLAARSGETMSADALLGRFVDMAHAYRFGPPGHDAVLARLHDAASGALLAEAAHVRPNALMEPAAIGLTARLDETGEALLLATRLIARCVTLDDPCFRGETEGFHLAPGETRKLRLVRLTGDAPPQGFVRALNAAPVAYGAGA